MKSLGSLLCIVAVVALVVGFSFDTSVATELGGRVHNIGLMNEKQNIIIAGSAMLVAGALLLGLSSRDQASVTEGKSGYRSCPSCAEMVKDEAKVCRYCQRDLPSLSELRAKEQAARQELAEARGLEGAAALEAEEKLPKGVCPNCSSTIPLASLMCRHCEANFGPGSAWRVLPHDKA